jgi:SAM-dependent methyltransferase
LLAEGAVFGTETLVYVLLTLTSVVTRFPRGIASNSSLQVGVVRMPQPWVTRAIVQAVRKLPRYRELRVLDLSCGEGEILSNLRADGYDCRGTHYRTDDCFVKHQHEVLREIPLDDGIDLHRPLPYADSKYGLVIMSEVLEHLGTHLTVVREVSRVLKPGGYFVFSTPNIHRVQSRWQFFLSGTHKLVRQRVGWDSKLDDLYAFHILPVDFPFIHTLLYQCGLRVTGIRCTRVKLGHAHWLLFYPLFWLGARSKIRARRKYAAAYNQGEQDLFRWMTKPAMLISDQLLVIARKQPSQSSDALSAGSLVAFDQRPAA